MSHDQLDAIIWQNAISIYQREGVLQELRKLNGKVTNLTNEFDQAQAENTAAAAAIAADVTNVQNRIASLSAQIADLQAQLAAGTAITPEQLAAVQASTASLISSDAALDAEAPDAT